jgi:hypothetical protein
MLITLEVGRGHLDVTSGCHRLYLGTHVSNSARWTGIVRLDPRVTPNKNRLAISHDRERPGSAVKRRRPSIAPVMNGGIMTKMVTLACSAGDGHNYSMCMPPLLSIGPVGPAHGGKGDVALGQSPPSFLSFFLFSLSLLYHMTFP